MQLLKNNSLDHLVRNCCKFYIMASSSREEIRSALAEVLTSPQFCSAINSALAGRLASTPTPTTPIIDQSTMVSGPNVPQTPTTSRQSLISSRIQEMFPSIPSSSRQQIENPRSRNARNVSRTRACGAVSFEREVLLVRSKCREETLKRNEKFNAFRNGYAKPAVKFYTNWGFNNIKDHLNEVFRQQLTNTDFDLFIPVSGFLSKIETNDEELTGSKLKRCTHQKPLYLRPHMDLVEKDADEPLSTESPINIEILEFDHDNMLPPYSPDVSVGEGTNDFFFDSSDQNRDTLENINNDEDFTTALRKLHNKVNELSPKVTYFNVNRENIFMTCKLALQRRNFDPFNRLSVNFVDVDEKTEGAIDGGGPTAEMFRLCLAYFQTSCLFEGNDTSKNLTYCVEQVHQNNYFLCGQMIGMSILHGYGGPNFLSKTLFDFLSFGIEGMAPNMDDLADGKLKTILARLSSSNDLRDVQNIILEEDMISISGWSFITGLDQKEKLVGDVLKFHLAYRVRPALEQFENGLKSCEVHHLIHKFPFDTKKLFCFVPSSLTFTKIKEMFVPHLNPQGSNLRSIENQVLVNYYNFLADCEGLFLFYIDQRALHNTVILANDTDVTLRDILIFTTGCCDVPPLGFKNPPSIEFLHNSTKIYPEASTCGLVLRLPVTHTEYFHFKDAMTFGIKNGAGFGFE